MSDEIQSTADISSDQEQSQKANNIAKDIETDAREMGEKSAVHQDSDSQETQDETQVEAKQEIIYEDSQELKIEKKVESVDAIPRPPSESPPESRPKSRPESRRRVSISEDIHTQEKKDDKEKAKHDPLHAQSNSLGGKPQTGSNLQMHVFSIILYLLSWDFKKKCPFSLPASPPSFHFCLFFSLDHTTFCDFLYLRR